MPYTYDDAKAAIAGTGDNVWWPRPNTKVVVHQNEASVFLYGGHIAYVYRGAEGQDPYVQLLADADMSNTTRNRLNDVLLPIGWKATVIDGRTFVVSRSLDAIRREYKTGMIVDRSSAQAKGN